MNDWILPLRYLHVLSASAWLGEVLVINVIMIPFLKKAREESLEIVLKGLFLNLFRLASVLSALTVITGLFLLYGYSRFDPQMLFHSRWGLGIFIGGLMGLLLTGFHFFIEKSAGRLILKGKEDDHALIYARLKIIPRIGLLVIGAVFLLMMYAVRGF